MGGFSVEFRSTRPTGWRNTPTGSRCKSPLDEFPEYSGAIRSDLAGCRLRLDVVTYSKLT